MGYNLVTVSVITLSMIGSALPNFSDYTFVARISFDDTRRNEMTSVAKRAVFSSLGTSTPRRSSALLTLRSVTRREFVL